MAKGRVEGQAREPAAEGLAEVEMELSPYSITCSPELLPQRVFSPSAAKNEPVEVVCQFGQRQTSFNHNLPVVRSLYCRPSVSRLAHKLKQLAL